MKNRHATLGVEILEDRCLMAVASVIPVTHDAPSDIQPVALSTSSARVTVEHNGASRFLNIQLPVFEEPRLIGILGGSSDLVREDGTARLSLPFGTKQVDLVLVDADLGELRPLSRIELDVDGNITSIAPFSLDVSDVHDEALMRLAETLFGSLQGLVPGGAVIEGSLAIAQGRLPLSHHSQPSAYASATTTAGTSSAAAGSIADMTHGRHAGSSGASPAVSLLVTSGGGLEALANGQAPNPSHGAGVPAATHATGPGNSPVPTGGHESSPDGESVDMLFAEWSDEESRAPAPILTIPKPSLPTTPQAPEVPRAEAPVAAFEPAGDTPLALIAVAQQEEHPSRWQPAAAILLAVVSAGGAMWLERRAQKAPRASNSANISPTREREMKLVG